MKINLTIGDKPAKEALKDEMKKDYEEFKENIKGNEYVECFKRGFATGAGTMVAMCIVNKILNR